MSNSNSKAANADVTAHRQLSPDEERSLEKGRSQWLPRIFQSYGTPIPDLMASPLKTGLIYGLPAGVLGAGLGSAIGGAFTNKPGSGAGALIGGLGAGGLAALAAYADREAKNEGLEELMRRMPEGAAKRDLLADPQYQADFLGWDNNKIVATARARYYRPTERFSKRTDDMAQARERYNERHKTSSVNKDVSMSQTEKQAMKPETQLILNYLLRSGGLGGIVGAGVGALTSKHKMRGAARGALMGAGTGLGVGAGAPVGGAMGAGALIGMTGRPNFLRPQTFQNLQTAATLGAGTGGTLGGVAGYTGGKALADALVGPGEDDDGNIKEPKKKNTEMKEEENKKAAQALLDNKTLSLAEKMAAYQALLQKQAEGISTDATMGANVPQLPGTTMPVDHLGVKPDLAAKIVADDQAASAPKPPQGTAGTRAGLMEDLGKVRQFFSDYGHYARENAKAVGSGVMGAGAAVGSGIRSGIGAVGDGLGAVGGGVNSLLKYLKPDAPKATMFDQLKPYAPYAAIGAGGLGAIALADYLSRRKKTNKKPARNDDEEYDMKTASINWYALARQQQKYAMSPAVAKPIVSFLPNLLARLSSGGAAARAGLAGAGSAAASQFNKLPQWAKITGGVGAAGAGGAGLGALGNLALRDEPSMLQQVLNSKYTPYAAAGLGAAGLLGGAAYMGSRAGKTEANKKKPAVEKQSNATNIGLGSLNLNNIGMGAGAGAALGGAGGALFGALNPGREQDPTTGRSRRRSRLMAALRGLAGGAAMGGVAGGAAGHFLGPQVTPENMLAAKQMYNRNTPLPTKAVAQAKETMQAAGEEPMYDQLLGGNDALNAAQNADVTMPAKPQPSPTAFR